MVKVVFTVPPLMFIVPVPKYPTSDCPVLVNEPLVIVTVPVDPAA